MKSTAKLIVILVITVLVGFGFFACEESPELEKPETEFPALTGEIYIIGTPQVGQTLTVDVNKLSGSGVITYQWKRSKFMNMLFINSEIGSESTYTLTIDDVGSTITVTVTRSGNSGSVTSVSIPILANPLPVLTGTVSINGTAKVGQTLTANTAGLSGSGTIYYQWFRNDSVLISSESTYIITAADVGSTIKVTVTRSGNSGSVTSNPIINIVNNQPQIQGTPGLTYYLNDYYTGYSVSRGTATDAEVIIPDTYNGRPVTEIEHFGFNGYTNMMSIIIPNSVMSIGENAFNGCTGLTSITIPNSVTNIGTSAFSDCTGLTSVTIPDSVTSIGWSAFYGCTGLTSITILNSVIGESMFYGCTGLTSVTIPDSVTSIGERAFYGCTGLTSITVDNSNTVYRSEGNCIIQKSNNTLIAGCKTSVIPNSVTSIGERAFSGCTGLTNITIPNSVTSIGGAAFSGCSGLTSMTIPFVGSSRTATTTYGLFGYIFGESPYTGGEETYQYYAEGKSKTYYIPASLRTVNITDATQLAFGAFYSCTGLTEITMPDSVTSIGDGAFRECISLTSVTIPDSVTVINNYVFYYCISLENITIPNKVTSIGRGAFSDCTGLTSITIPDSVTSILGGVYTYNETSGYGSGTGDGAFRNCISLTNITIPDSVKSIGSETFSGCKGLKSVTISNSVTRIAPLTFSDCTGLISITIPDSVTSIDDFAFYYCENLTNITIPDNVKSIGNGVFTGCTDLTSITIGTNVNISTTNNPILYFISSYNSGGKLAGTYTRPDRNSTVWTKQQ